MKFVILLLMSALNANAADPKLAIRLYAAYQVQSVEADCSAGQVMHGDKRLSGILRITASGGGVQVLSKGQKTSVKKYSLSAYGQGIYLYGAGIPKRLYRGELSFSADGRGELKIINSLDVETYLPSVLTGEIGDLKELEAYKAQAIAARTYTITLRENHIKDGYNLCDSAHCQVYNGEGYVKPKAREAVAATRGQILTYKGKPASTFYHASCGGRTEAADNVWPTGAKPYLISVKDGPSHRPYCSIAPKFKWKTKIYFTGLTRIARQNGWITPDETAVGMRVSVTEDSGRVHEIEIYTRERRVRVNATDFYHGVGRKEQWQAVKSCNFKIIQGRDFVILDGRGSGHGVGMCQWGAEGMARRGFTYKQILYHYYPGTEVTND